MRENTVPTPGTAMLSLAFAAVLSAAPAQAQVRSTADPVAEAQLLFNQRQPASTTASTLRRTHSLSINQTTTILRTVGYEPRAIVGAVRTEFNASLSGVYSALEVSGLSRTLITDAFTANSITLDCIDPQGYPRPCGNFGGGMDQPAMGQLAWSPQQSGYTDSLLTLTGTNIPSITVRIGSTTLVGVSASSSQVVVRLPSQPTQGPLTVRRTSDNVVGKLADSYTVVASPLAWSAFAPAAVAGAVADMKRWVSGARLHAERCTVNGALANGTVGVFSTATPFEGKVRAQLIAAGAPGAVADAWNGAFSAAWSAWADFVVIPALPWFPGFVAYPGSAAPLTAAPPTTLGALVSAGAAQMLSANLQVRIHAAVSNVSNNDPGRVEAVKAFSDIIGAKFLVLLANAPVTNVKGSGPVPSYNPPAIGAGPVENGTCSGTNVLPTASSIL